ncbi:MAG: hypothetical protein ACLQLO_28365 [Mycobacterium sp.]
MCTTVWSLSPPGAAQRFLAVFSVIFPHFRPAAIGSPLTTIAPK